MQNNSENQISKKQEQARQHIQNIKGFYQHLVAYILFIPFTIFINYKTYWDYKWFWYSIIIWGIGVAIHALRVFVFKDALGSKWEARKIEEIMRKEENKWE
ncbi:2TM domain-containing protein [Algibacter pectinivorans]|uniref:2TM domain-containing protein n=1 Tax=Algibacter pectinivorans TaxID=870482 RepID=A0A1I1RB65_9FLAO|nr:2TM domain-containing protein [Algibacter pectinivorans]SFD31482.1 2TM domain-containing protein [Algibacter pectinivorans]